MQNSNLDGTTICAICHKRAHGLNYGVITCNACKMFFRRSIKVDDYEKCKLQGKCFDGHDLLIIRSNCRQCRFQKCLEVGMHNQNSEEAEIVLSDDDTAIIKPIVTQAHIDSRIFQELQLLDKTRVDVFSVINIFKNPTFIDLVIQDSKLAEYMKPIRVDWENTERQFKPWGSLGILLVVEVIKTMTFYRELLLSDRVLLLKNVAFKSHHLCIAFDSYFKKMGRVIAPTGGEMFPPPLYNIPECEAVIMELLTSPMQPLLELKLTQNEFLLLNIIMICNPAIEGFSPEGSALLRRYQQNYSNLLLQLCLHENKQTGPSRFMNIVAICTHIDKQSKITQKMIKVFKKLCNMSTIPHILMESL